VRKPTKQEIKERDARAAGWKTFRREFLFSQLQLADVLGISRRTIVSIEGAKTTRPHASVLLKFKHLKFKHETERHRREGGWAARR